MEGLQFFFGLWCFFPPLCMTYNYGFQIGGPSILDHRLRETGHCGLRSMEHRAVDLPPVCTFAIGHIMVRTSSLVQGFFPLPPRDSSRFGRNPALRPSQCKQRRWLGPGLWAGQAGLRAHRADRRAQHRVRLIRGRPRQCGLQGAEL